MTLNDDRSDKKKESTKPLINSQADFFVGSSEVVRLSQLSINSFHSFSTL